MIQKGVRNESIYNILFNLCDYMVFDISDSRFYDMAKR